MIVDNKKKTKLTVLGKSVTGARHKRLALPNQDSITIKEITDKSIAIVAVADGMGDPQCFRSHTGSKIATEVAASIMEDLLEKDPNINDIEIFNREQLPKKLFEEWKSRVLADWKNNGFTNEE